MQNSKSFLKNTLVYSIGTFGSKALIFLLVPFFSYYLDKSELGIYDLVMSTVSLLVPFVTMQISNATYRWLLETNTNDITNRKLYITNSFFISTFGIIVFTILLFIVSLFYKLNYKNYLLFLTIILSYLPLMQYVLRGIGKTKIYSIAGIINAFLILVLNISFLLLFDLGIRGLFIATILANFFTLIFIIIKGDIFKFFSYTSFDFKICKEMLSFSMPLIPNNVNWWLINSADKFLILYFLGTEVNGIYAISSRFPTIITLINSVFILSWQDHVIVSNDDDNDFDNKIFDYFINFELGLILVLIASSELIIRVLVAPEYYDSFHYMPLLYIAVGFSAFASYLSAAFIKKKNTKKIFYTSLVSGLINIFICAILLKYIGLYASVFGSFIGYLIMFILRLNDGVKILHLKIDYQKLVVLTLLCLLFSYLISLDNINLNYFLIVISLTIALTLNRNLIIKFYQLIKKL